VVSPSLIVEANGPGGHIIAPNSAGDCKKSTGASEISAFLDRPDFGLDFLLLCDIATRCGGMVVQRG
jgi:hypothetical protein